MAILKSRKFVFALITALLLGLLFGSEFSPIESKDKREVKSAKLLAEEAAMTDVIKDGKSDYLIIFCGTDGKNYDNELANEISSIIKTNFGITVRTRADSTAEKSTEILIGNTNRAFSAELLEKINAASEDDNLVWAIGEKNGQIAYVANSEEAFVRGKGDLLAFITEESFSVPKGTLDIHELSREEYNKELKEEQDRLEWEKEQEHLRRIEELKKLISEFNYADFGDAPTTSMTGTGYGKPALYPNPGEHPRINVTSYMIEDILKYMEMPEAKYTVTQFWKLADTEYTGILPPAVKVTTGTRQGLHNMDEQGLAIIEAKAFAYLLTGNELYAYEAIYAMKNYLITIDIQYITSDQCREFGRIMYCTAEVYDWCYYLLSEEDKAQLIMACADIGSSQNQNTDFGNQMEVGFPPALQTAVSSHSSEHQILRDYLSIAIAIFDEDPSWYEWVGGLLCNQYAPFRDYYFQSGTYPQGVNIYAPHRFDADLWSAWLFICATGESPYNANYADITRSFFMHETPDKTLFGTGDGSRINGDGNHVGGAAAFWHHAVIASAIYGSKDLRYHAFNHGDAFNKYYGSTLSFSFSQMLILSGSYYAKVDFDTEPIDRFAGTSPVCYFGSPLGQMTVRSEWNNKNAAAVFMKLGERTTANHEHGDAGTFQIFYKGFFTGDSGIYEGYGTPHHYYYHQATVAHNGLLISNPERIGNDETNPASYFYSGSQRQVGEATNLDSWMNSKYDTGTVIGAEWAYKSDGTTDYAYLGGDITAAYDAATVSHVGRHMLTIYSGRADAPMYLVVYDKITSLNASYKKTFLLHTAAEPVIDTENKTVTLEDQGGRLVLKSLKGGDSIIGVGGADAEFLINGRQCKTLYDSHNGQWGRVEISPNTDSLTHKLLNFMYLTDAGSTVTVEPELIEAENLIGAVIEDQVIIFAESDPEKNTAELKFNIEGKGLRRFIVMGMFPGTWNISVDGVSVGHSVATDEGGMITFYAPAGEVTVSPGKNIVPSNGGRIIYNTFGGILPDDAPLVYEIGVPVKLPTFVENGADKFSGWYTSPAFEEDTLVTELVGTEKGKINLYAKYSGVAFDEDYEKTVLNDNRVFRAGISYNGKNGTLYKTVTDEETKNTYLLMSRGDQDPQIDVEKVPMDFLYGKTKMTLSIDLARDEKAPITGACRLRGQNGSSDTVAYFTIVDDGTILLGGQVAVGRLTEEFQTFAFTFDFEAGTLSAYDSEANELASINFTAPAASGVSTPMEWLPTLKQAVNWWMGAGQSLHIDNFSLRAGEFVPRPIVVPEGHSLINYVTNGGEFITKPEKFYKEGEIMLLEPNLIKGTDEFIGWYTTPDFQKGTGIVEISPEMKGELTVYAKWAGKLLNADFEGEDVNVELKNVKVDGVDLGAASKPGALFKSETDESGNTYIVWTRGEKDPQLKFFGNFGKNIEAPFVATYMIDLATVDGKTPMSFDFRVRSSNRKLTPTSKLNYISLFTTDTSGNVLLGGVTKIATLGTEFTKLIISIDFDNKTLIAYNEDASEIARVSIEIENYQKWLAVMDLPMYVYALGGDSIKFDNISINGAPYTGADDDLPESTVGKIDYMLGGGKLPEDAPVYFTKGEGLTLPIPKRADSVFLGWFRDPEYKTPITEISPDETESLIIYANWQITILDFNSQENDFSFIGDGSAGAVMEEHGGLTFQTKGQNSFYKTKTDESGEKYLLWSKGKSDPQIIKNGSLPTDANNNLVISYTLSFAKDGDSSFTAFQGRMRTPNLDGTRKELMLFNLQADGSLYLANSTSASVRVGQFGSEFKTLGVVADFKHGMLYGYNELGQKVCECAMSIHSSFATAEDMYNALLGGEILGMYAGGTSETTMRIKRITIETANIFEAVD